MKIVKVLFLMLLPSLGFAQDTIRYNGIIADRLLYESIELYPDSTFKWTSEYDHSFSSYGKYYIDDNRLKLDHYIDWIKPKTMTLADSIATIEKLTKSDILVMVDERMYRTDDRRKKKKRVKYRSLKTPLSWLLGHKYIFLKEE